MDPVDFDVRLNWRVGTATLKCLLNPCTKTKLCAFSEYRLAERRLCENRLRSSRLIHYSKAAPWIWVAVGIRHAGLVVGRHETTNFAKLSAWRGSQ